MRFLNSMGNAVADRSPEELIGALLVVAVLAGVMAGVYAIGRRKSNPDPAFVGILNLAAGAVCMVLTAGYVEYKLPTRRGGPLLRPHAPQIGPPGAGRSAPEFPTRAPFGPRRSSGFHVVIAADIDRDGRLTRDEAARMVTLADTDGDGNADVAEIDRLVVDRIRSRFQPNTPGQERALAPERHSDTTHDRDPAGHAEE